MASFRSQPVVFVQPQQDHNGCFPFLGPNGWTVTDSTGAERGPVSSDRAAGVIKQQKSLIDQYIAHCAASNEERDRVTEELERVTKELEQEQRERARLEVQVGLLEDSAHVCVCCGVGIHVFGAKPRQQSSPRDVHGLVKSLGLD